VSKGSVGDFSHTIRTKNTQKQIILIYNNLSSYLADHFDDVCRRLDICRVSLPRSSPDIDPIEQIGKSVKRGLSSLDAEDLDEYRELIVETFDEYAHRLSFAQRWIERFLNIQKL